MKSSLSGVIIISWFFQLLLILLLVVVGGIESHKKVATFEELGHHADYGDWGNDDFCPEDSFVSGLQLGFLPFQGTAGSAGQIWAAIFSIGLSEIGPHFRSAVDDYGLTGIQFRCTNKDGYTIGTVSSQFPKILPKSEIGRETITPSVTPLLSCQKGEFAKGFKVKSEKKQGSNDDSGITNFWLRCTDNTQLEYTGTPAIHEPGDWGKDEHTCPTGSIICGLRTKVETTAQNDNTGLNALKIHCCEPKKIVDPISKCSLETKWVEIFEYDNSLGYSTAEFNPSYEVGISNSKSKHQSTSNFISKTVEELWGVGVSVESSYFDKAKVTLQSKYEKKNSETQGNTDLKGTLSEQVFKEVRTHNFKLKIYPGIQFKLEQLKITCDHFFTETNRFRQTEKCIPGKLYDCPDQIKKIKITQFATIIINADAEGKPNFSETISSSKPNPLKTDKNRIIFSPTSTPYSNQTPQKIVSNQKFFYSTTPYTTTTRKENLTDDGETIEDSSDSEDDDDDDDDSR